MITVRRSDQRGQTLLDWLDSRHTFSFNEYYDAKHTNFRKLRVINEDIVRPGQGFGTHSHRDMEILTWVLDGALEHKDSLGNGSVIRKGDLQRMSAGTGILHSEFNHSQGEPVHFLQIWIFPASKGLQPQYEQKTFQGADMIDRLLLVASSDGRNGAVSINQDADLYVSRLSQNRSLEFGLASGRHVWVQVTRGSVTVNDANLEAGDGAAVSDERSLRIKAIQSAELLLFDLA